MKAYTDLPQSKKLAEILPIESADMWFANGIYLMKTSEESKDIKGVFPCWSLAALLSVLPKYIDGSRLRIDISKNDFNLWFDFLSSGTADEILPDITKENPVDACYEMIVTLHEQKNYDYGLRKSI